MTRLNVLLVAVALNAPCPAIRARSASAPGPYVGAGHVATPRIPVLRMSGAASLEGGLPDMANAEQRVVG